MKFETKQNGTTLTFKLKEKRLDSTISPELKGEFLLLCKPRYKELRIDLSEVEFCDSNGLSALLIAERKMRENGGKVKLIGVQKKVLTLIKITHLDLAFEIEPKTKTAH
ncbi:MAG: STAS domain-containing protein [Bacteroidetes bacterium]|nr:STAS domain-containing protein [Bacteroidota bacterium]